MADFPEPIQVIELQPDDVLVYRFERSLSREQAEAVRDTHRRAFGERKALVIDSNTALEVVRP